MTTRYDSASGWAVTDLSASLATPAPTAEGVPAPTNSPAPGPLPVSPPFDSSRRLTYAEAQSALAAKGADWWDRHLNSDPRVLAEYAQIADGLRPGPPLSQDQRNAVTEDLATRFPFMSVESQAALRRGDPLPPDERARAEAFRDAVATDAGWRARYEAGELLARSQFANLIAERIRSRS